MMQSIRRGHSLAELLTVLALLTAIISLNSRVLVRFLREVRRAQDAPNIQRTLERLETQLRTDCHMATQVNRLSEIDNAENRLSLTQSTGLVVDYVVSIGRVNRTAHRDSGVMQREEYILPEDVHVAFSVDAPSQRAIMEVTQVKTTTQANATKHSPSGQHPTPGARIPWARVESTWGTNDRFLGATRAN